MNKIKVLHISKYYPPYIGGIEITCSDVVTALENSGNYSQKVIAYNTKKSTEYQSYKGVNVVRVGTDIKIASQPLSVNYGKELRKLIVDWNPDIIHFHFPNPYAAFFLLKYLNKYNYQGKFILHWHTDIVKQKFIKIFFNKQCKNLICKADRIIITSPLLLKDTDFLPKYSHKNYSIISSCINEKRYVITDENIKNALNIKRKYSKRKIIFFFGRHVEYKGIKYLIDSNKYLDQNKVIILIGGKGPLTKKLKKYASSYKNIIFTGVLSDNELNEYLLASDIFAFPSITRNEAFGISLAEALYFGKPAVTFSIKGSGVNWVNKNMETGLEATNKNSEEFAKKINILIHDENLYSKLSKGAKNRSASLFTKEKFETNILNLYKEISK